MCEECSVQWKPASLDDEVLKSVDFVYVCQLKETDVEYEVCMYYVHL